jgi:hypothetical protein
MTRRLDHAELLIREEIAAPPLPRACTDRGFDLPTGLYVAMAAMFLGFVGVLGLAFRNPEMAVPFGICVVLIVAFFTVPTLMVRTEQEGRTPALDWSRLRRLLPWSGRSRKDARPRSIGRGSWQKASQPRRATAADAKPRCSPCCCLSSSSAGPSLSQPSPRLFRSQLARVPSRAASASSMPRDPLRRTIPSRSSWVSWRLTVSMVRPSNEASSPRVSIRSNDAAG